VKHLFHKQNCSRNRIAPSQEQCFLWWNRHLKLSQICAPPNFSGTARFEKRPDVGRFTNRPYGWYGEIVCFETVSSYL